MEGEFEEEPDGSPNEQSGSNLNEESFLDNNTEQQEGDSQRNGLPNQSKQLKRIFLFPIDNHWSAQQQILVGFGLLFIFVLIAVFGMILGNMFIATYLIKYSAKQETEENILLVLENSVQVCLNLFTDIFFSTSVQLGVISKIFAASLGGTNELYENGMFPLKGKNRYISIHQSLPSQTDEDKELSNLYYSGVPVSLDYISYFSFTDWSNFANVDAIGMTYVAAADVLVYFLKSLIYFKSALSRIQQVYIHFEGHADVFYPGGSCTNLLSLEGTGTPFQLSSRDWYKVAVNDYTTTKVIRYLVTGPYVDLNTGLPCITISQVILNSASVVIGVVAVDILTSQLQVAIPTQSLYESGIFFFASRKTGMVLNDPMEIHKNNPYDVSIGTYYVNSTAITGFTSSNWDLINNSTYKPGKFFEIDNLLKEGTMIVFRLFTQIESSDSQFVIFAAVPKSECYYEYDQISNQLTSEFQFEQYIFLIVESSFSIVSFILTYYFASRIVSPLKELAASSKELTNKDKDKKRVTIASIGSQKKKTLEEITTSDEDIDVLIHSFKKLVKDLTGFKKGTRKEGPNLEDRIEYPQKEEEQVELFYQHLEFLQDLVQFQNRLEVYAYDFMNLGDILRANNIVDSLGEEGDRHSLAQGLTKAHGEGQRFQESAKGSQPDRDFRNEETRNTGFREDRKASDSYSFNADLKMEFNDIQDFKVEQQNNNTNENADKNEIQEIERGSNENTDQPKTREDEDSQARGKYREEGGDCSRLKIELRDVLYLQIVIHNLYCIFEETLRKTKKLLLKKADRQLYTILQNFFFQLSLCYKHVDIIDMREPLPLDSESDENQSEQASPVQRYGQIYKPDQSQGILLELILSFHDLKNVSVQKEGRVNLRKVKLFHKILPHEQLD